MVTAICLIHTNPALSPRRRRGSPSSRRRGSLFVAGEWDLVAIIRVRRNEDLADLITSNLSKVPGVLSTRP